MIKRISHIKNFGVFQDYRRTGDIQDFKKLNTFYGWNYSGKTTIARLFNCLEREELHEHYTTCEFEIIDQDNNKFSESNLSLPDKTVRVFNSDFVRKNVKWDGEAFNPILLLGEESIEAEKEIGQRKAKIERINSITANLNTRYKRLETEIENELTNKASNIKTQLGLVETFTKTHLRPIFNQVRQNHIIHKVDSVSEQRLLKNATASEDDKLPKLEEYTPSISLSGLIDEVKELVKQVPEFSKIINYFIDNPEVAKWVELGLLFHEEKDECEYCGNTIPQLRRDDLLAHFSEDLKNHNTLLNDLSNRVLASKLQAPQNTERDFYQSLRDEFTRASANRNESIKEYNKQLDGLNGILQTKKDKPFEAITDLSAITDCSETTSKHITAYNLIISKNNENTEKFDENKTNAIDALKKHYTALLIDELDPAKKEKKIALYQAREQSLTTTKQTLNIEILQIEAQISNAQKGREKLNEYIHSFFGREEIGVEVQKDGENDRFTLKRDNDNAINLSEGEKTAIAFSFFLTKLLEIEDLKSAIVYIDDPVSSLDSNHIFQVNALLKGFFFHQEDESSSWELKCDQLFFSTHNYEFFTLLRELPLKKEFVEYYYIRRIDNSNAMLERLPKALRNYTSEYHYLFSEIHRFHNSDNKGDYETLMNIPNAVRRFVELYTYSKIPGNWKSQVDNRTDKLFGKEKSKRIMKVLHYFSHSNNIERMVKNSDLICDIENAVNDLMDELKRDSLHYDELEKSIQN